MSSQLPGRRCIALLFACLAAACTLGKAPTRAPEIRLLSLMPEQLGLQRQVFRLQLGLSNPNEVSLRVAGSRLHLELAGVPIGSGELIDSFSIAPGAQGSAAVRIVTNLVNQAPVLLQKLMVSDGGLDYRVTGYVDFTALGLGRLKLDERGRLGLAPPAGAAGTQGPASL